MKRALAPMFAALAALGLPAAAGAADIQLRFIGQQSIPTGTLYGGVEFGGISGLDLDRRTGTYWAISDDRGGERGTPRFYNLSLSFDAAGFSAAAINGQAFMRRPDGTPFPATARTVDPEGIRVLPNGNLVWSSEGNFSTAPANLYQPFVREMRTDGAFVREFTLPPGFDYVDDATAGGRNNKLFEALAVAPNGTVFVANEDALIPDGPITTLTNGSVVRVTAFDPASGTPSAQYAYELPSIPKAPAVAGGAADNGLPELLALSDTSFIALERAFAAGSGNTIKLALASLDGATNVLGVPSLAGAEYAPMRKEYLLDLDALGIRLDNTEALSFGPALANGNRTLVLASDNNFSAAQTTQFLAFEIVPVPEPASLALLFPALGLAAARRIGRERLSPRAGTCTARTVWSACCPSRATAPCSVSATP